MRKTLLALLIPATALAGCAISSRFEIPKLALPDAYPSAPSLASPAAPQASPGWWRGFADPRLDALVEAVLARNNDLAAAALLVRRARLQADLATDARLPHASGGLDVTLADSTGPDTHTASLSASWQLDLFGKLAAEQDAARWEARATAQDLAAARLTLISTTLDLYWQLAELNERIASIEASIAYAQEITTLVQARRAAGAVSDIDVQEARQSLESQRADLESARQSRLQARSTLALLLGAAQLPQAYEPPALPTTLAPPVDPGRPAQTLSRRPDLQAAELRLRKALSTLDAARASVYPQITLTGSAGGASPALNEVLANPTTLLGLGVDLPFLDINQRTLQRKVSQTDYERSVLLFRQALLEAFGDVETALSADQQLAREGARRRAALDAAQAAERLYKARYDAGATALRLYLDAQEQRRTAERAELSNRLALLRARAGVFDALGGG